jgi:hypothetical protein
MDRPSTIMLCNVVPGIGLKVIRVFGFGDQLRILQRFQKSRFHGADAILRHAGRHGIGMHLA